MNLQLKSDSRVDDLQDKPVRFSGGILYKPRYILMNIEESPIIEMTDDEKIDFVAARILREHKAAFLELAK